MLLSHCYVGLLEGNWCANEQQYWGVEHQPETFASQISKFSLESHGRAKMWPDKMQKQPAAFNEMCPIFCGKKYPYQSKRSIHLKTKRFPSFQGKATTTLPETMMSPLKIGQNYPKKETRWTTVVFQPSIFRCKLAVIFMEEVLRVACCRHQQRKPKKSIRKRCILAIMDAAVLYYMGVGWFLNIARCFAIELSIALSSGAIYREIFFWWCVVCIVCPKPNQVFFFQQIGEISFSSSCLHWSPFINLRGHY